jgi:hypothetical protein
VTEDVRWLLFALGLVHLAVLVRMWHLRALRRFPCFAAHVAIEGLSQVILPFFSTPGEYAFWRNSLQPFRLLFRLLVVMELWRRTVPPLGIRERQGLFRACIGACACAALLVIPIYIYTSSSGLGPDSLYTYAMFIRQWVLLAFAIWLVLPACYVTWSNAEGDHNLIVYRGIASLSAIVTFCAATFVWGGIGYRLQPFLPAEWTDARVASTWCLGIFLGVLAFRLRPDPISE